MHVTAMLLPEKEKHPRIIHVELQKHLDDDMDEGVYRVVHLPFLNPYLGDDESAGGICSQFLKGQPIAHLAQPIHLRYRDSFMLDGSAENACIAKLFGALYEGDTLGAAHAALWRGPLVALKSQPIPTSESMDPDYVDLHMADVHDVLELLKQYGLARMSSKA